MLDCTSGAVYAWQLGDKKLFSRRFASDFEKFFIALATLTYKILPESEQNLKFLKQIKKHFFDKKWLIKFSKFRLVQPKFSFINLNLQTSEFLTKFSLKTRTRTINL